MMRSALKFNPDNTDLGTLFREWQIRTMKFLWDAPREKFTTKEIWCYVCEDSEIKVSRATVYHFLDAMARRGIINYQTGTGRGGLRVLFYSEYNEEEFREMMAKNLIHSLERNLLSHRVVEAF